MIFILGNVQLHQRKKENYSSLCDDDDGDQTSRYDFNDYKKIKSMVLSSKKNVITFSNLNRVTTTLSVISQFD